MSEKFFEKKNFSKKIQKISESFPGKFFRLKSPLNIPIRHNLAEKPAAKYTRKEPTKVDRTNAK